MQDLSVASPTNRKSSPTKYDMRLNPVYHIDFQNCAAGKRFSMTKRRVRFRFGFSNAQAIKDGLTGAECRGEEHDVALVWSVASGKRLILMDGEEVHFSVGNRTETLFETSWSMNGGHIIKIVAHATPALFQQNEGFRQFDLFLDGCSIFDMPRIYELGVKNGFDGSAPISQLPVVSPNKALASPVQSTTNLQDTPSSAQTNKVPRIPVAVAPSVDLLELVPEAANHDSVHSTPTTVVPGRDEFTPVEMALSSHDHAANQIMSAYQSAHPETNGMLAICNYAYGSGEPAQYQKTPMSLPQQPQGYNAGNYGFCGTQQRAPVTPELTAASSSSVLTMEPLSISELEERGQPDNLSEMERSFRTLVNIDDITEIRETPEQRKTNERKFAKMSNGKSVPLPPTTPTWQAGMNATLGDIREHAQPKPAPKQEIMKTHAFDPAAAQAGMMVVHGSTNQSPPPGYCGYQNHDQEVFRPRLL